MLRWIRRILLGAVALAILAVFAGLVFLLGKFAWGPILRAVDEREKGIQSTLDQAAERNAEAAKLLEEHKAQLADARRQASELIAEGRAAGDGVRKEIEDLAGDDVMQGIINGLSDDYPIWANKVHKHKPLFCKGDKTLVLFRKWVRQFYLTESDKREIA